jgi:hypothetical protein
VCCNANNGAFNEAGELVDERVQGLIQRQLVALHDLVLRFPRTTG